MSEPGHSPSLSHCDYDANYNDYEEKRPMMATCPHRGPGPDRDAACRPRGVTPPRAHAHVSRVSGPRLSSPYRVPCSGAWGQTDAMLPQRSEVRHVLCRPRGAGRGGGGGVARVCGGRVRARLLRRFCLLLAAGARVTVSLLSLPVAQGEGQRARSSLGSFSETARLTMCLAGRAASPVSLRPARGPHP